MLNTQLKIITGFDEFRPMQKEVIQAVLDKKDTLAVMPTGGGKSLCYQFPTLINEKGCCVIFSPLQSLMKDQADSINKKYGNGKKIAYAAYGGHTQEHTRAYMNMRKGDLKFLFVSPERIHNSTFTFYLQAFPLTLIAIDEAHCISEWGHDFRPSYQDVVNIRGLHPNVNLLALTATANERVKADIITSLKLGESKFELASLYSLEIRTNLKISVMKESAKIGFCQNYCKFAVKKDPKICGIIYVNRVRRTKEIAKRLTRMGIKALPYNGQMPRLEKEKNQNAWMKGEANVIVATNAFGMGIDKENVRFVIHADLPNNMEAYAQEIGRGGRDGKTSDCVLLYKESDIYQNEGIQGDIPELKTIRSVYQFLYMKHFKAAGVSVRRNINLEEIANSLSILKKDVEQSLNVLQYQGFLNWKIPMSKEVSIKCLIPKQEIRKYGQENLQAVERQILNRVLREKIKKFAHTKINPTYCKPEGTTTSQVIELLESLAVEGFIECNKVEEKPYCLFVKAYRLDFSINKEYLIKRKMFKMGSLNSFKNYLNNFQICRVKLLNDYFQKEVKKDCGICDICRAKNKSK